MVVVFLCARMAFRCVNVHLMALKVQLKVEKKEELLVCWWDDESESVLESESNELSSSGGFRKHLVLFALITSTLKWCFIKHVRELAQILIQHTTTNSCTCFRFRWVALSQFLWFATTNGNGFCLFTAIKNNSSCVNVLCIVSWQWAHYSYQCAFYTHERRSTHIFTKAPNNCVRRNVILVFHSLSCVRLSLCLSLSIATKPKRNMKMKMRFTKLVRFDCAKFYAATNCGVVIHKFCTLVFFCCCLFVPTHAFFLISFWMIHLKLKIHPNKRHTHPYYDFETIARTHTHTPNRVRTCDEWNAINSQINANYTFYNLCIKYDLTMFQNVYGVCRFGSVCDEHEQPRWLLSPVCDSHSLFIH